MLNGTREVKREKRLNTTCDCVILCKWENASGEI